MKRRQILAAVDPEFIHHDEYTTQLPAKNLAGAVYKGLEITSWKGQATYYTVWDVRSAEDPLGITYKVKIALDKLVANVKVKPHMMLRDAVTDAVGNGDILVACDDPSQAFWGYNYICHKRGILFKNREIRKPKVRNPKLRGIVCKHIHLVLQVLPFSIMKITSDLKKRELKKPQDKKEPVTKMTLKKKLGKNI